MKIKTVARIAEARYLIIRPEGENYSMPSGIKKAQLTIKLYLLSLPLSLSIRISEVIDFSLQFN